MKPLVKSLIVTCSAFVIAGCIEKERIVRIPDAENILFTSQGDLIVSGGKNIYHVQSEITPAGAISYQAKEAYDGRCNFVGIAQKDDWVFAVCQEVILEWHGFTFRLVKDVHLLAADLRNRPIKFEALDTDLDSDPLDSMSIPNGIAFTPSGQLLIADENFFAQSSVGRITLDFSGEKPIMTEFEADWLNGSYGLQSPNGVRVANNKLYVSDGNKVRRFFFDANGDIPYTFYDANGELVSNLPDDNVLYRGSVIIDDIMPYCGGIAVTHYLEGQMVFQNQQGKKFSTLPFSFSSPSALAIGQGPLFDSTNLLVTEKGIIFDTISNIGNRLSRIKMDFDLADPLTCEALNEL